MHISSISSLGKLIKLNKPLLHTTKKRKTLNDTRQWQYFFVSNGYMLCFGLHSSENARLYCYYYCLQLYSNKQYVHFKVTIY